MKEVVISLGGSLIFPNKIDVKFIDRFKKLIRKNYHNYKFIIVCGGGIVARYYIDALEKEHKSKKDESIAGMRVTRMNAHLLMKIFGKEANDTLPLNMKDIKDALKKNKIVICGALRFTPKSTSDGTAAKIAHFLKTEFINMTNTKGLYTDNPVKNKNAKFIPSISWKDFEKRALAIKFKAGEHFVLDQKAAVVIRKNKIKTYIIGKDLSNLDKLLNNKKFIGTTIYDKNN